MYEGRIQIGKAAALIGVTPQTLRNWDGKGKLRAIRSAGRHRYYTLNQLQPYLAAIDAIGWLWATQPTAPPVADEYYCERQDRFSSRLVKLSQVLLHDQSRNTEDLVSLLTLVTGEIGDNSFAHNVGNWPDVPGLFFGYDIDQRRIVLADRGRGVLTTLRQVRPALSDDRVALRVAFTQILSGREPEKRGNGLKVVRRIIQNSQIQLWFQSGAAVVQLDRAAQRLRIATSSRPIQGTFAVITWQGA